MSTISTAPTVYDANGVAVPEADGRAAEPWNLRSELEGSRVPGNGQSGPAAELPGSQNFAGEQGAATTLGSEANRQIGPGWQGQSLKVLNGGVPKKDVQASTNF